MLNPFEIHEKLQTLGLEWADSNSAADILEEVKKVVLAQLITGLEGTHAAKEQQALANPAYKEHLTMMCEARRKANAAKVKYESAKVWAELMRTQAATERQANRYAT
jgi:uncharacterized protein (DUF849 family)